MFILNHMRLGAMTLVFLGAVLLSGAAVAPARADGPGITVSVDPGVFAYRSFIKKAWPFARPRPEAGVRAHIATLVESDEITGMTLLQSLRWSPAVIAMAIKEALNIDFLMCLPWRGPEVEMVFETRALGYTERWLRLRDPWVGTFEALLQIPDHAADAPGLLLLHGHGQDLPGLQDYLDTGALSRQGFVVLIIGFREMDLEASREPEISMELMEAGFTLMGLRVYEASLGLKVLRALPFVAPQRLGMIGHSGGGAVGNLLVRLDRDLAVYVTDHHKNYLDLGGDHATIHCQTIPSLYPFDVLVNDFQTSLVPILEVDYGCPGICREEMMNFLMEHLHPSEQR